MTLSFTIDGTITLAADRVRLNGSDNAEDFGFTSSAYAGGPDTAHIRIEDPDGDLELTMMHFIQADESDCDPERIWTGIILSAVQSLGPNPEAGIGCVWDLDCLGVNSWAGLRVLSDRDNAKRPAETNFDRIEWLFGTTACVGLIVRDPAFIGGTELDMEALDTRGMTPAEVLDTMGGEIGRNWYIFVDPDTLQATLWYGAFNSGLSDSTLAVSDVLDDQDATTLGAVEPSNTIDSSELYAAVLVKFRGSQTFVTNTATAMAYIDRHAVVSNDRIGRLDTARAFGARFLDEHDAPREMLRFGLDMPDTQVNLLREGQRVDVRFNHLPNYRTPTTVVIRTRTVMQASGNPNMYRVNFEASTSAVPGTPGGGDPGEFPHQSVCDVDSVTIVQQAHSVGDLPAPNVLEGASLASDPTPGNLLVCLWAMTGEDVVGPTAFIGTMTGWDQCGPGADMTGVGGAGGTVLAFTKTATSSESFPVVATGGSISLPSAQKGNCYLFEVAGVDAFDVEVEAIQDQIGPAIPNTIGTSITPTAGKVAAIFSVFVVNQGVGFAFPITPDAGMTELYEEPGLGDSGNPGRWVAWRSIADTTGSYSVGGTENIPGATFDWAFLSISLICSGSDSSPDPGQPVEGEVVGNGDGTTTVFFTDFPYASGSLKVFVDGVPIINGLTESDPTTGEFTLDFAPKGAIGDTRAEIVTVNYQGR